MPFIKSFYMFIVSTGPFSTTRLEEAGFYCPKLQLALRNPRKISRLASQISQDGAQNLLDYGILRSSIDTSKSTLNIVEGLVTTVESKNLSFGAAVKEGIDKIPYDKYALIFIDDKHVSGNVFDEIKDMFDSRSKPEIFTGTEDTSDLKKWLCEPQKRKNDMCIIGKEF